MGKFAIWVLKELVARAEDEWYNPDTIRQELELLSKKLDNEEIKIDEFSAQEELLLERLIAGRNRGIEE